MSYGQNLGWRGPIGDYIGFLAGPSKGIYYKFSPGLTSKAIFWVRIGFAQEHLNSTLLGISVVLYVYHGERSNTVLICLQMGPLVRRGSGHRGAI